MKPQLLPLIITLLLLLKLLRLNSKNTEISICLKSIDLEMMLKLLMKLSLSSSKNFKELMTSLETNNMMK